MSEEKDVTPKEHETDPLLILALEHFKEDPEMVKYLERMIKLKATCKEIVLLSRWIDRETKKREEKQ